MSDLPHTIRDGLVGAVRRRVPRGETVAVLLSGGVDSTAVLLAARAAGYRDVIAYSFALDGSDPTDFEQARTNASRLGVPFVRVDLPRSIDHLIRYTVAAVREIGLTRRVDVQCMWPRIIAMQEIDERYLLTGDGADACWGLSRSAVIEYKGSGRSLAPFQREYLGRDDPAQIRTFIEEARSRAKIVRFPWLVPSIHRAVRGKTWETLNTPRHKQPARQAFPVMGYLDVGRRRRNLHGADSGIKDHFDRLTETDLNVGGWKTCEGIINAIARGEAAQPDFI